MSTWLLLLFIVIQILFVVKFYFWWKLRWCQSKLCLVGKTTIVTGANKGIGYETALEFAKRGAKVILACRDLEKAEIAKNKIIVQTNNNNIIIKELNLSSLQSVREFAKNVKESEERIDILVNNAGSGFMKHKFSADGLQILMQINYFGPTLLTILLIDLLKKSAPSRIVNVSSALAKSSDLTTDNLNKVPSSVLCNYRNSKLANILFTIKLAELLKGSKVSVFSLHPGVVATDIFKTVTGFYTIILPFHKYLVFKTPEQGAQTTLHTALEQGLEKYSGHHFSECSIAQYEKAQNLELVEGVWKKTIDILKCNREVEDYLMTK